MTPSSIIPTDSGGATRTKLTNVNVPMKANKMQKPIPKPARSDGCRRCSNQLRIAKSIGMAASTCDRAGITKYANAAPARFKAAKA